MPRPRGSFKTPSLTLHKPSGRARVCIDGRDHYCGEYGTADAQHQYERLIAEWILRGKQAAPDDPGATAGGLTVSQVIAAFWQHATSYYRAGVGADGRITGELDNYRLALRPLRRLYGNKPAAEFGPLALKAVRADMLKPRTVIHPRTKRTRTLSGSCRTYANRQVNRLRHVFKWASENELIPASVYHGLLTVAGLRKGKSDARESDPVKRVPDADVDAVLAHVAPPVKAMIELERITGMRPDEVCSLRGVDIDTRGEVWLYRPAKHKTAHHGLRIGWCHAPI